MLKSAVKIFSECLCTVCTCNVFVFTAVAMDDVMQDLRQLAAELLSTASDSDENEVT